MLMSLLYGGLTVNLRSVYVLYDASKPYLASTMVGLTRFQLWTELCRRGTLSRQLRNSDVVHNRHIGLWHPWAMDLKPAHGAK